MKNIFHLFFKVILPLLIFTACSQFLEETEPAHAYSGTDGCVYCHTNDTRLKVLAEEETGGDTGGGG